MSGLRHTVRVRPAQRAIALTDAGRHLDCD
jgi:hypothetical protein